MQQGPIDFILAASAARTADPTLAPASISDVGGTGAIVITDVTVPGTGSITVTIEGFDPASNKWYPILASAALTTAVTSVIAVYPGATAVANSRADLRLPRTWRVRITHNNANTMTYSVGVSILP